MINDASIKAPWLTKLRWSAVAIQFVLFSCAKLTGLSAEWTPFLCIAALLVVSNIGLTAALHRIESSESLIAGVLFFDTAALTILLYFYGGASNPFSMVYLAHVVLAAFLLGIRWTWAMVVFCSLCFAALFIWNIPVAELSSGHHHGGSAGFSLHLQGMLLAFFLMATVLAYFLTKIIASLREKDRELGKLRLRAFQEEKLASLTTLAAGAAHELNTPLSTIKLIASELAQEQVVRVTSNVLGDVTLIKDQVLRCEEIIRRMSGQMTESQGEIPAACEWGSLCQSIRQELGENGWSKLHVVAPPPTLVPVIPRKAVAQALASLAKNSFDASSSETTLTAHADVRSNRVIFELQDHGKGMSEHVISRLGEPFFTTKEAGKGMGLGVFLVKLLARRLGGDLAYESVPGNGTKASFSLPLSGTLPGTA